MQSLRWVLLVVGLAACNQAAAKETPGATPATATKPAEPPGPCATVGEVLTSYEIGNYASVAQRKPLVAKYTSQCHAAGLSAADTQCIIDSTKATLPYCARPLMVAHQDKPVERPIETTSPAYAYRPAARLPTPTSSQIAALPQSCQKFLTLMKNYGQCQKLPAESAAAIQDAMNQAAAAWVAMPAESRQVMSDACSQANDAMKSSMQTVGC